MTEADPLPSARPSPFSALIGPVVALESSPTEFEAEVRAETLNTMGTAHGGFIAALVDIAAGQSVRRTWIGSGRVVTRSTAISYLRPAQAGQVLHVRVDLSEPAERTITAVCSVTAEGTAVASAVVTFAVRS